MRTPALSNTPPIRPTEPAQIGTSPPRITGQRPAAPVLSNIVENPTPPQLSTHDSIKNTMREFINLDALKSSGLDDDTKCAQLTNAELILRDLRREMKATNNPEMGTTVESAYREVASEILKAVRDIKFNFIDQRLDSLETCDETESHKTESCGITQKRYTEIDDPIEVNGHVFEKLAFADYMKDSLNENRIPTDVYTRKPISTDSILRSIVRPPHDN